MTSSDQRVQTIAATVELARRRLVPFAGLVQPKYQGAAHTRLLCDRLEALERRDIRRLLVAMPPRHGKSLHVAQTFPAWVLGRNPSAQIIVASYAAELAESHGRRIRDLVRFDRYAFKTSVSETSSSASRWNTTAGGAVVSAGVGGGLTGFGADLLVVDDYCAGRDDADSPLQRERVWSWFTEVALTRLQPGGCVIVCATRWHEDDLSGRILSGDQADQWEVLELPALAVEDDALGREPGEALWPAWFDREHLQRLRQTIGSRAFSALYQQAPSPAQGVLFQRNWFGNRYEVAPGGLFIVQTLDGAWRTGVANDPSVIATWGLQLDGAQVARFYLLDVWRDKVEFPDLVNAVKQQYQLRRPARVICEDAASGLAIVAELQRNSAIPIVGVRPQGSKTARAEAVTPHFEAGRVFLPRNASWLEEWISEHLRFPAGKHDDMVDTTSLALSELGLIAERSRIAERYRAYCERADRNLTLVR